jgi:hypothetical protein
LCTGSIFLPGVLCAKFNNNQPIIIEMEVQRLGYGLDDRVQFPAGEMMEYFVRPALGPTQPPIQWVPGALASRVKLPGREADRSPPSSAKVKNAWSYTSTLPIRLHSAALH